MRLQDIAGFAKQITSSKRNEDIILGLVSDNVYVLSIGGEHYHAAVPLDFKPEGDDLGWLGYFIGKCTSLRNLVINDLPGDVTQRNQFITGLNRNRSIQQLCINDLYLWYDMSEVLGDFFRSNKSLSMLGLRHFDIGYEEARDIASTIRDASLTSLTLASNELCREGFEEIIRACTQSQIDDLCVSHNNIGRNECTTLGTLLGSGALNKLTSLDLKCNAIDDNSLEMLAAGLVNNTALGTLSLTRNPLITADGLRCLIPFLQSESCSLRDFFYYDNDINDVDAAALAHGLAKNKSLEKLWFDPNEDDCRMTSAGWHSFATLLCDTSSINNTYLSNHTLKLIGESCNKGSPVNEVHERVRVLLRMHNNASSRDEIATRKILWSHRDLDMEPFFEWELKFLPMIVSWLAKAHEYDAVAFTVRGRDLSAVYKFVRAMPLLAVRGRQTLCRRCGRKRKFT